MESEQPDDADRARGLAARLGFMTEDELRELGNYTPGSLDTMRKRGDGPPYTRFGNRRLYPIARVAEWLVSRVREPRSVPAGEVL